ncbi:diacylglycerol kinase [Virgibacillus sp. W0181]|uniref:diacylglycerol kinase n=1 Tax=Virgibacillus sp. W0181 TaxID=3391581 RepID=UPI003F44E42B
MNGKKKSIGFSFAWNGLKEVFKTERNFKIQTFFLFIVILASIILRLTLIEWAILLLASGAVLVTEIINSAIERMMDYIKPDIHPLVKIIKDIAASAVLVAALVAVCIGLLIFGPKIFGLF